MGLQQMLHHFGIERILVALLQVQVEFVAAGKVRPGNAMQGRSGLQNTFVWRDAVGEFSRSTMSQRSPKLDPQSVMPMARRDCATPSQPIR